MEPKHNNRASNKMRAFWIIVLLLSANFILIAWGASMGQSTGKEVNLCNHCHQMNPEIYTWQASTHRNIPCSKCHSNHSVFGMFLKNRNDAKAVINARNFVSDSQCLDCHTKERLVTPPDGLIISHSIHSQKGIDCVDCHKNIAHAQVKTKFIETGIKDFDDFTIEDAKQLNAFGNRIPMKTCLKCHNGAKAPEGCAACHKNKFIPTSHKETNWNSNHGNSAVKNLESCNFCHEYDVAKQQTADIKNGNYQSLQQYAKNNTFCENCHKKRPEKHNKIYYVAHNKSATDNKQFCFVCHNWDSTASAPSNIMCVKCHVPSVHPRDWVNVHKDKLQNGQGVTCFSCHDQYSCTKCHAERGVNLVNRKIY